MFPNRECTVTEPSNKLVNFIAAFEGFRARAYKCAAGNDTIGYGHVIGDDEAHMLSATLTKEEGLALLRKDIAERTSLTTVRVDLEPHQRDALTSLCFNIGKARFNNSEVVKRINRGELLEAREFFGHWRRAAGAILPGLCMRRLVEACVFAHASLDPASFEPPSKQWNLARMPITDDNWNRMSVSLRRRAITLCGKYWKE